MNYIILLISHTTRLYGLLLCFIFLTNIAYSQEQSRFFVGLAVGPNISFNKLESNRPLPDRISTVERAGISLDFFLEYTLTKNISLQANLKTASRKTGIRYSGLILERDAQGQVRGTQSGTSVIRNAPAHINIGIKVNSNLLKNRFIVATGIGFAYMIVDKSFAPPVSTAFGLDDEESLYATLIETKERNYGLLLNTNVSVSYRVGVDKFIFLVASYNQGLVNVYKQESQVFDFQTAQGTESYQVSIFNKGIYAALQLGYKMPVNRLPLIGKK